MCSNREIPKAESLSGPGLFSGFSKEATLPHFGELVRAKWEQEGGVCFLEGVGLVWCFSRQCSVQGARFFFFVIIFIGATPLLEEKLDELLDAHCPFPGVLKACLKACQTSHLIIHLVQ